MLVEQPFGSKYNFKGISVNSNETKTIKRQISTKINILLVEKKTQNFLELFILLVFL